MGRNATSEEKNARVEEVLTDVSNEIFIYY